MRDMLGQGAAAITETANGLRQFKPSVVSSVQLLLGNRYAVMPGEGSPVLQVPGVSTFVALTPSQYQNATGGPPTGLINAWQAIQQRDPPSAYVLVDSESVAQQLEGGPDVPIVFYIAGSRQLAQQLSLGSTAAVVAPIGSASTTPDKEKKSGGALVAGAAVGGLTLLATGNPIAAVGAGIIAGYVAA